MDADKRRIELNLITDKIIGSAYTVSSKLGCGFLEKVYENALAYEIRKLGLYVSQQEMIQVYYDDIVAGVYAADLLVEERVLVELKTVKVLNDIHLAQCMNYLKATRLQVCLLINFALPKIEVKRVVNNF